MSQENVELACRATDAFNRRDLDTPLDESVWQLARWRAGKCIMFRILNSRAEALEAAGLSEQDAHAESS